ncbi:hypothetical protein [Vibrio parahaemolyticus]|uniref:hypothetical protein n=1 Tax=Vibrio parahaemolyticus TaxID=670 RepID=UPI001E3FDDD7|nr:hypothetical protein [Vibrio parahaemolyticus]
MKKYLSTVLISTAFLMSGCDVAQLVHDIEATEPTLVIAPTTELQISDAETAHVVGYDKCPEQSENMLMGNPSMKFLPDGCINLGKDVKEVRVTMRVNDIDVIETWKVDHQGDAVSLIRPNGFQVRDPSNQS